MINFKETQSVADIEYVNIQKEPDDAYHQLTMMRIDLASKMKSRYINIFFSRSPTTSMITRKRVVVPDMNHLEKKETGVIAQFYPESHVYTMSKVYAVLGKRHCFAIWRF
jgi:hypothetical protein